MESHKALTRPVTKATKNTIVDQCSASSDQQKDGSIRCGLHLFKRDLSNALWACGEGGSRVSADFWARATCAYNALAPEQRTGYEDFHLRPSPSIILRDYRDV